jgi:hypothetical protein
VRDEYISEENEDVRDEHISEENGGVRDEMWGKYPTN